MKTNRKSILRNGPTVCAVGREYQIMVPVNCDALMRVSINGKVYDNHANGVRRSQCAVQRFCVPMEELDAAGEYTLIYNRVLARRAYSCLKGPTVSHTYRFSPIADKDEINLYVLSDCHGIRKESIEAGSYFGESLDLLLLNGDVSSSCMTLDEALLPYDIAFGITQGHVPCIITRGNHDLRGVWSEHLHELIPSQNGRMYYTVEFGPLWLLVLDCGEDKDDGHREYGGTAAFHAMRCEETLFLRAVAEQLKTDTAEQEKHRIVVSHIPVPYRDRGEARGERPFDIEEELYAEWTRILNENIRPELYIAGHLHRTELWRPDSPKNCRGIDCPVLIAGKPLHGRNRNVFGAAVTLGSEKNTILFTDKTKQAYPANNA